MRVIIAAAGTAGHINPGISIANKIMQEDKNSEIIFIGTTRGLENDLVSRAGYELKTIEAYGLSKKISIDNMKKIAKTLKGFNQAKEIIKEFKPDIVIGTGGYICGATISAAKKLGIPTMLHESNAFPGRAIKMLAKKTDTIMVSFKDTFTRIKGCKNVIHTGTPIRIKKQKYSENKKLKIINDIGLKSDKSIVLIFGGSQGAEKINHAIVEIIRNKLNKNYQIVWATGQKQFDIIKENLELLNININNIDKIKILPYIYNMEEVMNVADVVVSRSGAITVMEISNLGKPSILIPLPNVSNNHQFYNAKILADKNAAKIIVNDELKGNNLNKAIEEIVLDSEKSKQMAESAYKMAMLDVENKIYKEIEKLLK